LRFRSFEDANELQKDLVRKKPEKIDIGGVYNVQPKMKDSVSVFQAREKELVFDIDISDYDDVRVCCQDKSICDRCWPLMSCALQILDRILKEDFGFKHLMYVFSGRRGVHCWTCDKNARKLTDEERTALASYINVYEGGEAQKINIEYNLKMGNLHPSLESVYKDFIKPGFRDMFLSDKLNAENSLHQEKTANNIMKMVARHVKGFGKEHEMKLNKALTQGDKSCEDRWRAVSKLCAEWEKTAKDKLWVPKYIEFLYMYPRLDVNVSKQCNHLLKAPFVIHPGTGNVCLPLSLEEALHFEPSANPKLQQVLGDYGNGVLTLEPYLENFQVFIDGCRIDAEQVSMDVDGTATTTA